MKIPVNSMPAKGCKKSQLKKAVGCRVTVGFIDGPSVTGIYLPLTVDGNHRLLTTSRVKGRFKLQSFDGPKQVIWIDDSAVRPLLNLIYSSPAEQAAKDALILSPLYNPSKDC